MDATPHRNNGGVLRHVGHVRVIGRTGLPHTGASDAQGKYRKVPRERIGCDRRDHDQNGR
jgi:hypothetical protein